MERSADAHLEVVELQLEGAVLDLARCELVVCGLRPNQLLELIVDVHDIPGGRGGVPLGGEHRDHSPNRLGDVVAEESVSLFGEHDPEHEPGCPDHCDEHPAEQRHRDDVLDDVVDGTTHHEHVHCHSREERHDERDGDHEQRWYREDPSCERSLGAVLLPVPPRVAERVRVVVRVEREQLLTERVPFRECHSEEQCSETHEQPVDLHDDRERDSSEPQPLAEVAFVVLATTEELSDQALLPGGTFAGEHLGGHAEALGRRAVAAVEDRRVAARGPDRDRFVVVVVYELKRLRIFPPAVDLRGGIFALDLDDLAEDDVVAGTVERNVLLGRRQFACSVEQPDDVD